MTEKYLSVQKIRELQKNQGWLFDYEESPETTEYVGEQGELDIQKTLFLNELAKINRRRKRLIELLMKNP